MGYNPRGLLKRQRICVIGKAAFEVGIGTNSPETIVRRVSTMRVTAIASYLVHPGKGQQDSRDVIGTMLPLSGSLYDMLDSVFTRSEGDCTVPISFDMADDGSRSNEVRDQLIAFLQNPDLETGRMLANRLRDCTTNTPGLGLLFLILGQENGFHKIVFSRFPADTGILAEASQGTLQVAFIERVFMKSKFKYKAALYQGSSFDSDFWDGSAVDKQIRVLPIYWIQEFLASDFKTTSMAGTFRLAVALRKASHTAPSLDSKQEIVSAITLVPRLKGQALSAHQILDRFGLSQEAQSAIISHLPQKRLVDDTFILDPDEFKRHAAFASVMLNTGAIMTAPADRFDDCFSREAVDEEPDTYQFTSVGRIVDERLGSRKW